MLQSLVAHLAFLQPSMHGDNSKNYCSLTWQVSNDIQISLNQACMCCMLWDLDQKKNMSTDTFWETQFFWWFEMKGLARLLRHSSCNADIKKYFTSVAFDFFLKNKTFVFSVREFWIFFTKNLSSCPKFEQKIVEVTKSCDFFQCVRQKLARKTIFALSNYNLSHFLKFKIFFVGVGKELL